MISEEQSKILTKILGPLEIEIVKILWKKKKATVQEVLDELQKGKEYAYTTIMTVMSRLANKGVLIRNKEGKLFVYQPAYTPEELIQRSSSHMIHNLLDDYGDVAIAQFVDVIGHKPEKFEKLKRFIQQMEQGERS